MTSILSLTLPAVLLVGLHVLWRHSVYGAWLPNTYMAKVGVPLGPRLQAGALYVLFATLAATPLLVTLVMAWRRLDPRQKPDIALPLAIIAWWILYVTWVGGDHFALFRFIVPVVGLCAVIVSRVTRVLIDQAAIWSVFAATVVVLGNSAYLATPDLKAARTETRMAAGWARTGQWCAANLEPGPIATLVVGAIPFYCDYPTLDLLGLVDLHIARYGTVFPDAAVGHQKHDTDYILRRKPRYIFFSSSGIVSAPQFRDVESRRRWGPRTNQALAELTTHPDTIAQYMYRAEQLSDGTWIEFLERHR
jgi:hypothetical protein